MLATRQLSIDRPKSPVHGGVEAIFPPIIIDLPLFVSAGKILQVLETFIPLVVLSQPVEHRFRSREFLAIDIVKGPERSTPPTILAQPVV